MTVRSLHSLAVDKRHIRKNGTLGGAVVLLRHSTGTSHRPVELERRIATMSKSQRQPPRKPATKFAHLRKKMQNQKKQAKKPRKK
jgi:hypothetical protein